MRLLTSRSVAVAGIAIAVLGLVLPAHGVGIRVCAWNMATGCPCPGCGLTRSVSCAMHGDIGSSFAYHPFGMVLLFVFALAVTTQALPGAWRRSVLRLLLRRYRHVRCAYLSMLVLFVVYGVARAALVLLPGVLHS